MNNDIIAKISAPVKQLNGLTIEHAEKVSQLQLQAAKRYTDLAFEQLRAAFSISDARGLEGYVKSQSKLAESLTSKARGDAETLVELNKKFGNDVQKIVQESASSFAAAAKPARKAAAA